MDKSVYSLVLADEVVLAVDDLAARQGLSRSALVEQILAEYANLQPPGVRTRQIVDTLIRAAGENGLRPAATSGTGLTLRTSLSVKYNPALSYTVQLRGAPGAMGQLRVALRSQNEAVLNYFALFFQLWQSLEQKHLPKPPSKEACQMEEKRYLRDLRRQPGERSGEETGLAIAGYIQLLDGCMKVFFRNLQDAGEAVRATEARYLQGLEDHPESTWF